MSHIETIMLIILGFVVAAMIALVLGRLLWGQAVGLGKRRSRREDPQTIAELRADKDKLRAEYAMLQRKLELRFTDLKTRLAEQTAEVSRNRNRVERMVKVTDQRDLETVKQKDEIQLLKTQMIPLEEELAKRTQNAQELKEKIRNKDETITDLHKQLADAQAEIAAEGAKNDALQDRLTQSEKREKAAREYSAAENSARNQLDDRIENLTKLSLQIEEQRNQMTKEQSELTSAKKKVTKKKTVSKKKAESRDKAKAPELKVPEKSLESEFGSDRIETQLKEAELETKELQHELARLDDEWNDRIKQLEDAKPSASKLNEADEAKDDSSKKEPSSMDNVISMANRIRSLQKDIKG